MDGDDGNLRAGFLIDLLAEGGDFLFGGSVDDPGKIVDVALRRKLLDFFGAGGQARE